MHDYTLEMPEADRLPAILESGLTLSPLARNISEALTSTAGIPYNADNFGSWLADTLIASEAGHTVSDRITLREELLSLVLVLFSETPRNAEVVQTHLCVAYRKNALSSL